LRLLLVLAPVVLVRGLLPRAKCESKSWALAAAATNRKTKIPPAPREFLGPTYFLHRLLEIRGWGQSNRGRGGPSQAHAGPPPSCRLHSSKAGRSSSGGVLKTPPRQVIENPSTMQANPLPTDAGYRIPRVATGQHGLMISGFSKPRVARGHLASTLFEGRGTA